MVHIWVPDDQLGWRDAPLTGDELEIHGRELRPARHAFASAPTLWRVDHGARDESWVLVASPHMSVRVNGQPLVGGICVLANRDLIQVGAEMRLFYCTDRNATVVPMPDVGRTVVCQRCKVSIRPGTHAVQCPVCRTMHHEDAQDGRPCWTYADSCSRCDCPTDLSLDTRWTPHDL